MDMVRNHLRLALRNLLRNRGLGLLNVVGLGVGIAACLLIVLFARSEWAVNADIPHVDRLYRVDSEWREPGMGIPMTTLAPVGHTLVREYPEVVEQTRVYGMMNTVRVGEASYREDVMLVDSTLFDVFELPFLYGDQATALDRPRSLVLSERRARAWFGQANVVGRIVEVETWNNGWQPFSVTGVLADLPYNSFSNGFAEDGYDVIMPYASNGDFVGDDGWSSWQSRYILQVVRLAPNARLADVSDRLESFIPAYAPEEFRGDLRLRLNPFRTIHLTEFDGRGMRTIRLLALVAGVILLLACINFANLATARSVNRVSEVGVRKAIGAQRGQLAGQFLGESILASGMAALLGLGLAAFAVRPFLALFDRPDMIGNVLDGWTLAAVAALAVVAGLLAGAWPALVFSSYRPAVALRPLPSVGGGRGPRRVRDALIVLQFVAAIVLAVGVVTISRQLDYLDHADLGFRSDQVFVIDSVPREWDEVGLSQAMLARDRMVREIPAVRAASISWGTAADGASNTRALLPEGRDPSATVNAPYFLVDDAFLDTYEIPLIAGHFFSSDRAADAAGVVLNESAARAFGWTPDEAVGRSVQAWFQANAGDAATPGHPVIGVVADHHFELMRRPVRPAAYLSLQAEPTFRVLSIRLDTNDVGSAVRDIRSIWTEVFPAGAFEHFFLDEQVQDAYRSEHQVRTLVGMAAILALFLAGMGMLGMASLSVAQRTKEIGVRRVLGATIPDVALKLSSDFLKPVAVAVLVGGPSAYALMHRWMAAFPYRAGVSWLTVAVAGVAALVFAGLVVSVRTLRAAATDPARSLRYE